MEPSRDFDLDAYLARRDVVAPTAWVPIERWRHMGILAWIILGALALIAAAAILHSLAGCDTSVAPDWGIIVSGTVTDSVYGYAIAPFIAMRAYEQIRVNLSISSQIRPVNVNLIGVGGGVSYQVSGPTHHCLEDLSIMRLLPNMTVFSPSDAALADRVRLAPDAVAALAPAVRAGPKRRWPGDIRNYAKFLPTSKSFLIAVSCISALPSSWLPVGPL